jgi:hypothetical protein
MFILRNETQYSWSEPILDVLSWTEHGAKNEAIAELKMGQETQGIVYMGVKGGVGYWLCQQLVTCTSPGLRAVLGNVLNGTSHSSWNFMISPSYFTCRWIYYRWYFATSKWMQVRILMSCARSARQVPNRPTLSFLQSSSSAFQLGKCEKELFKLIN